VKKAAHKWEDIKNELQISKRSFQQFKKYLLPL